MGRCDQGEGVKPGSKHQHRPPTRTTAHSPHSHGTVTAHTGTAQSKRSHSTVTAYLVIAQSQPSHSHSTTHWSICHCTVAIRAGSSASPVAGGIGSISSHVFGARSPGSYRKGKQCRVSLINNHPKERESRSGPNDCEIKTPTDRVPAGPLFRKPAFAYSVGCTQWRWVRGGVR